MSRTWAAWSTTAPIASGLMNKRTETFGIIAVVLLVVGLLAYQYLPSTDAAGPADSVTATDFEFDSDTIETEIIYDRVIDVADLPAEAIDTLLLIDDGGPYPYNQDGSTFQNREGRLPDRGGGHYQEFTVDTPGLSHRGPLRIVAGADGELYWTADHYDSFAQIVGW